MAPSKMEGGIYNDFQTAIFNPPQHPPDQKILSSRLRGHTRRMQYILWNIVLIILIYLIPDSLLNQFIISDKSHLNFIFHLFQCIAISLYFLTSFTDPGYIPLIEDNQILSDPDSEHVNNSKAITIDLKDRIPSSFCASCKFLRPIRSKHCYDCGKCVIKYDHHCIFLGNCIGGKNHRWFLLFLIFQTIFINWCMYISWLTFLENIVYGNVYPFSLRLWILRFIAVGVISLGFVMIIGLSGYHCYLSFNNLTSYERNKPDAVRIWRKEMIVYGDDYVHTNENDNCLSNTELKQYVNGSFDKGMIQNFIDFWMGRLEKKWQMPYECVLEDGECELDDIVEESE